MKKSDKVMIYQDPLTELEKEGKAILYQFLGSNEIDKTEDWIVRFHDGCTVRRTIRTDGKNFIKKGGINEMAIKSVE